VGFVLLILYLCSLPVFSGVCVIDSVPVFTASFQWCLCYWFCTCVHCQFSVVFVLLILYLCSLPVFSGVCVIDSVSVFTASFQWCLCYWFCTCVHCQFSVGFVLLILYLCSLPVFSGVCVIDSVSVFASVNTDTESITQTPLKTGSEHRYRINNTNPTENWQWTQVQNQ
jgi:hypothetical protein